MLNEGFFGIGYGQVLAAYRRLFKVGQGSSQVMGEAIVLGTSDVTGPTVASKGSGAPVKNVPHFVIQLPYSSAASGANVTGAAPLCLQVPDGDFLGGNVRGVGSIDLQTQRVAATNVASGTYAFATGRANQAGDYSGVVGNQQTVSAPNSFGAGYNGFANGSGYNYIFGFQCVASGSYSFAAGQNSTANANGATTFGMQGTARGIAGTFQFAGGQRAALGDRQYRLLMQSVTTSNATTTTLTTDGGAEGTGNTWVLPNNYSGLFTGLIIGRNTANNDSIGWEVNGMCTRDASAATVALLGSATITALGTADASMSTCTLAANVNTTNGSVRLQVTGLAATTIAWSGYLHCIENG